MTEHFGSLYQNSPNLSISLSSNAISRNISKETKNKQVAVGTQMFIAALFIMAKIKRNSQ
jgi:hypothetical protein